MATPFFRFRFELWSAPPTLPDIRFCLSVFDTFWMFTHTNFEFAPFVSSSTQLLNSTFSSEGSLLSIQLNRLLTFHFFFDWFWSHHQSFHLKNELSVITAFCLPQNPLKTCFAKNFSFTAVPVSISSLLVWNECAHQSSPFVDRRTCLRFVNLFRHVCFVI